MHLARLYSVSSTVSSCPEVRLYQNTHLQVSGAWEDTVIACIVLGDKSFMKVKNQGGFPLRSLVL